MIFTVFQWIQSTPIMTAIRESAYTYPVIMSIHLSCIAVFGGLIVITDLRLLGYVLKNRSIADVVNGLRWWKRIGFVIMASMGLLLAGSKAETYYPNPYFWLKMSLLLLVLIHAIIFRPRVYNHPEQLDHATIPRRARVAGALSLVLWTSVLCAGRMIGYYEDPAETGQAPTWTKPQIAEAPAASFPGALQAARSTGTGDVQPLY
ncbi:MAG: hypothetical protein M3O20_13955 [Acidobacteriota bacterium]|nr:hypothetical protein [Acidobacteriota bacterium]